MVQPTEKRPLVMVPRTGILPEPRRLAVIHRHLPVRWGEHSVLERGCRKRATLLSSSILAQRGEIEIDDGKSLGPREKG